MRRAAGSGPAAPLAACPASHTGRLPLEGDARQVETQASGHSTFAADGATARRAAELLPAQGYEGFGIAIPPSAVLDEDSPSSGKVIVGS